MVKKRSTGAATPPVAPRERQPPPKTPGSKGFPVVGIGASAGGLEAIEALFRHMPADTGMAFVLVQHLDPNHQSILSELIARYTPMPVAEATHGVAVEPNRIYVIPPRHDLAIAGRRLELREPSAPRHLRLSIDHFFRSLAQDQGANALCIVLSGAGSDGAMGLRAIKGEGGLALVQAPDTAAYDSMPRSADATGLADAVLPPEEMGPWLRACRERILLSGRADRVSRAIESGSGAEQLFQLVRKRSGYDFSQYKEGTIGRRIERRMAVNGIDDLEDYLVLLAESPEELDRLWKEFLIRVTQFFRNPGAFSVLRHKVVPHLFETRPPSEPIRVWVPGCSTGEEAFTIAMLLQEHMERLGRIHGVQIFATDIDEDALEAARVGVFPASIAADLPEPYLKRCFYRHHHGFQITKALRSMLVFSRHDVTRDPPFSRMDLVSCRNLLIYMRPPLQGRVLDSLTYALNPDGILVLGHSESLGPSADLYQPVDKRAKIFRRLRTARSGFRPDTRVPRLPLAASRHAGMASVHRGDDLERTIEAVLLAEHTPACVVVNERQQVLYVHGHTGRYLEPAIGLASMNVVKMAREGLRAELGSAIREVTETCQPRRHEGLRVRSPEGDHLVTLTVKPLQGSPARAGTLLIVLEDAGPVDDGKAEARPAASDSDTRIAWLEQELADTRETLQNANEALETSNEELQSTIEELQSSNEELTTSQEELSSINEELHTVNVELEDKVHQLEITTDDLENLLASTDIGTVFLDRDLQVRRFTPAAATVINLLERDIGRPLGHIAHRLEYDRLVEDADAVLDSLQPRRLDVRTRDGTWYSLRISLYRTGGNAIDGVVLTFVDLTELKLAEDRIYDLLELTPDATLICNRQGTLVKLNRQAERLFGYDREELLGQPVEGLIPATLREGHRVLREAFQRQPRTRHIGDQSVRLTGLRKDGSEFPADIAIGPIRTRDGQLFAATVRDLGERLRTQLALERSNGVFQGFCHWNQVRHRAGETPRRALPALCRCLVGQPGCLQCWIGLDDAGEGAPALVAHAGFPDNDAGGLDLSWIGPGGQSGLRVLRQVQGEESPQELRERARAWGCHAILAAPLGTGERHLGLLLVTAADPRAYTDRELLLWQTLGSSLSVMLEPVPGSPEHSGKTP